MRESIRRALAGLLAIAIVSTAAAPVGTAAAQTSENTCSDLEQAAIALSLGYGGLVNDCNNIDTSSGISDDLEADEMRTQVFSYATGVEGDRSVFSDTLENYLNDTKTIARVEAQSAYVNALENDSDLSQSQAKIEAQQEVEEYYATKQRQLINQYQVDTEAVRHAVSLLSSTNNSATVDGSMDSNWWSSGTYSAKTAYDKTAGTQLPGHTQATDTVELVNSESVTYETIKPQYDGSGSTMLVTIDGWDDYDGNQYPDQQTAQMEGNIFNDVEVVAPDSLENSDRVRFLDQDHYVNTWNQIEEQEQQVTGEIGDLVDGTYTEVQSGEIDPQDLVDPYMGAREYDPENETLGSSWSLRTIMSLGLAPPENLDSMGNMTIRNETSNETYTGILMSDSAPSQSDGFTVGETYDATAISGSQMVAGSDGSHHSLTTQFTLVGATNTDGSAISDGTTIDYGGSISYSATNLTEWKEQMSTATNRTVEIQVRQQRLTANNSGGGGGGLFGGDLVGSLPYGGTGVVVAIGAIVVLGLVTRN